MPFNRNHVRAFLAKTEIDLFESSLGDSLKALTAAEVQRRIDRTRKLRTKYRDLLQRQKLATRDRTASKSGAGGDGNARTAKKAKAFDETLSRFEAQAKHLEAARKKAAAKSRSPAKAGSGTARKSPQKKRPTKPKGVPAAVMLREALQNKHGAEAALRAAQPARSSKAPASSSAGPVGDVGVTSPNVRATVVASRLNQSGLKRIQGHSGTQVRMAQAKRDHRG